jgi:hypothetical protein
MNEKMIQDAYCRIRTIDNTIPDDVLDFMLEASLQKLKRMENDLSHRVAVIGHTMAEIVNPTEYNRGTVTVDPEKTGLTLDEITRPAPIVIRSYGYADDKNTITLTGKDARRKRRENERKNNTKK